MSWRARSKRSGRRRSDGPADDWSARGERDRRPGGASWAGLKAWNGWLELKRLELAQTAGDRGLPPATGRIEIADLRERVRKLEAIAAGIDIYPESPARSLPRRASRRRSGLRAIPGPASFFGFKVPACGSRSSVWRP